VHHRQLWDRSGGECWLLAVFRIANSLASLGHYGALPRLPAALVHPLSHLDPVFGPALLAIMERRGRPLLGADSGAIWPQPDRGQSEGGPDVRLHDGRS